MLVLALSLTALLAQDDAPVPPPRTLPPCSFEGGAVLVEHKADLPPQAISELERLFAPIGGIADAGAFFQNTDVIKGDAPKVRLMRAYHVRDIWFVWYERGGIAVSTYTMALVPTIDSDTGEKTLRMAPGSFFQGDLCAGSKAFLAGARSGS